ncbi:MAG TPA: SynChlorMet cassette protein ScmC [Candidatus Brocadiia bacterium]|nr:SynChlorMet cassette protein ScmC [Candidatus Brocadiales bacterium]
MSIISESGRQRTPALVGGFSIKLCNGQGWYIVGNKETQPIVETLASILQIEPGNQNGYPRLIFTHATEELLETQDFASLLSSGGWRSQDLPSMKLWHHDDTEDVICELNREVDDSIEIFRLCFVLNPIYQRALEIGGLPLHAGLVELNGRGALLAARGNIGKSTCCSRIPQPWRALCDDESLIVLDARNQYRAHPFPTWSNYLYDRPKRSWNVQQHVPLAAIFFLEQAEKDEVVPIGQGQAGILINTSATEVCSKQWRKLTPEEERAQKKKLFDNACALAKSVPAFILRVSLTGRFWDEMERVLPDFTKGVDINIEVMR